MAGHSMVIISRVLQGPTPLPPSEMSEDRREDRIKASIVPPHGVPPPPPLLSCVHTTAALAPSSEAAARLRAQMLLAYSCSRDSPWGGLQL